MKNKLNTRTIALRVAAVVFALLFVFSACLLVSEIWDKNHGKFTEGAETLNDKIEFEGETYRLKEGLETILVLGLDKFSDELSDSYNNNQQADFVLLFIIDDEAKTYKAVHLNRDSMVEMNVLGVAGDKIGTVKGQLALSHAYGNGREISCRNTANAVSKMLLGMEIDHYVSVTMDAVPAYNDLVGGITLEILDDFTSIDETMVQGETVTLMGDQALYYVRSRYGLDDPSNNNRMKRQRQYLEALFEKSKELALTDDGFIARVGLKMTDYIVSDCSGNRLEETLRKLSEYTFEDTLTIKGETVMGEKFLEFYPNEDSVKEVVIDCFYETEK